MSLKIPRRTYADLYGPTKGDRIRLADTELIIEIEKDFTHYGDEITFGGGKVIRDGMGQSSGAKREGPHGALDLVITNAVILDHWGIVKADIGVKDGRIVKVGKAGNPDTMDGVDPELVVGASTEVIAGENLIVTAGGIDSHIHFISPQQIYEAISNGITTMIGGGTGPATGTAATTCTPGAWNLARMLQAADAWPMNFGFLGKGNAAALRAARRADRSRRVRPEAARRLGHHSRRDRRLPQSRRRIRRAGRDPHRHDQRSGIPRSHGRCHRRPHDSHLSHRGRRRRPRAGHHPHRVVREYSAVVDESHAPLHRQHDRRASRHADGLPPPESAGAGGRRVRRKPHPSRDDRRRGHPARPRRAQHAFERFAGDGTHRRSGDAHLADGAQNENAARPARRGFRAQRQFPRQALRREVHDQSGDHARNGARKSARSSRASWPISSCGSPRFSA